MVEERIRPIRIEDEMRGSYLDYAMSTIVARALPDVRDGLKPVHRRILYAMDELSLAANTPFKKSARIVGEVLGKYHPHSEGVYETMVRLAQDFAMRYPLVDGQGNFGSVDNDPPAAMRYTEARMSAVAEEMLGDIEKDTVDMVPNFDGSFNEPLVLPTRLPQLLVNGSSGIAVGMTTNIPPHNLTEVCDAVSLLIDNPEADVEAVMAVVKGPDFPTGGVILGREGIRNAYSTGHGKIVVRARARIEESARGGRIQIVVTELPYLVNKAALVEHIADLAREKRLDGITDLRDESDRQGMRIAIELRRDAQPQRVLNALFKHTSMQTAFHVNMVALVEGAPRTLTLRQALVQFIVFRRQVIERRSRFDLGKAQQRAHILEGLKLALDAMDRIIATIRRSQTADAAKNNLMRDFGLSEVQAQAILDMQLRRLARLERDKVEEELTEVLKTIAYLEDLLANPKKVDFLIQEETQEIKKKYGDDRRTVILHEEATELTEQDLIPHQEVVVTQTHRGYIKRVPASTYRSQGRGGRGVTGVVTREADAVMKLLVADTHDDLFFFTNRGKVYRLPCYDVPEGSRNARGLPVINLISIEQGEAITAVIPVREFAEGASMVMATRRGEVKRTALAEFSSVRSNGLIAMDLEGDDELVAVRMAREGDDVLVAAAQGRAVRFPVTDLRLASRQSGGVRAIRLKDGDRLVSLLVMLPGRSLLSVTARGHGKRTPVDEYPTHQRGGQGVISYKINDATGPVVACHLVERGQEAMVISASGVVIRTAVDNISQQHRSTAGVSVMRVAPGDSVVSVTCLEADDALLASATAPVHGRRTPSD